MLMFCTLDILRRFLGLHRKKKKQTIIYGRDAVPKLDVHIKQRQRVILINVEFGQLPM